MLKVLIIPQYDKPTIFGDKPGMPYNKLIEEALGVTTKAGEPLTNGTPLVDFGRESIPNPQLKKVKLRYCKES